MPLTPTDLAQQAASRLTLHSSKTSLLSRPTREASPLMCNGQGTQTRHASRPTPEALGPPVQPLPTEYALASYSLRKEVGPQPLPSADEHCSSVGTRAREPQSQPAVPTGRAAPTASAVGCVGWGSRCSDTGRWKLVPDTRFGQVACCFGGSRAGRGYLHGIRRLHCRVVGSWMGRAQMAARWEAAACRGRADAWARGLDCDFEGDGSGSAVLEADGSCWCWGCPRLRPAHLRHGADRVLSARRRSEGGGRCLEKATMWSRGESTTEYVCSYGIYVTPGYEDVDNYDGRDAPAASAESHAR